MPAMNPESILKGSKGHSVQDCLLGNCSAALGRNTMQVLAISNVTADATRDKIKGVGAAEIKHTVESYLDGSIRSHWYRADRPGVVFILESADVDEARRVLDKHPLVAAGLVNFDLFPLKPLSPLGTLIGRPFSFPG